MHIPVHTSARLHKSPASIALLAGAVLMLLFSCPLKRLLQNEDTAISFAATELPVNSRTPAIGLSAAFCMARQQKTVALVPAKNGLSQVSVKDVAAYYHTRQEVAQARFCTGVSRAGFRGSAWPLRLPKFLRDRRLLV